jgi:hypothetical protein
MSILVTLKQIVDCREALMSLSQQKLPVKPAYDISKIIRKANEHLEHLTKIRLDVISKHAPQGTTITPEINQDITAELTELLDATVEIPVNRVDLSRISGLEISARDIIILEPFVNFENTALE